MNMAAVPWPSQRSIPPLRRALPPGTRGVGRPAWSKAATIPRNVQTVFGKLAPLLKKAW